MREAANQHNIFIRTRIRRFADICGPLRIFQLRTMAGAQFNSSGKLDAGACSQSRETRQACAR